MLLFEGGGLFGSSPFPAKELPRPNLCSGNAVLTDAIVIGMVGVVAGFAWDYVQSRGR